MGKKDIPISSLVSLSSQVDAHYSYYCYYDYYDETTGHPYTFFALHSRLNKNSL